MSLKDQLMQDLQDAMRNGDELRRSTIRMVRAAIKNAEIAGMTQLDDVGVHEVLRKEVKQRRESADEYTKGKRPDLAENEMAEVAVIEKYMPKQLSEEEITAEVRQLIKDLGASGPKDKGKVMPAAMAHFKGRADGRMINQVVDRLLSE